MDYHQIPVYCLIGWGLTVKGEGAREQALTSDYCFAGSDA